MGAISLSASVSKDSNAGETQSRGSLKYKSLTLFFNQSLHLLFDLTPIPLPVLPSNALIGRIHKC